MPIFKAAGKLIFYAHVPKCGGSALEQYLHDRFGAVAFQNPQYLALPQAKRWSKTSPQHIDTASLDLLFPPGFFDASFTVVRHPVARLVSAYHFQRDLEKSIAEVVSFGDWLEDIQDILAESPFALDNHIRPMTELVPEGSHVFHLEHGLDALVPWLDLVSGTRDGPRAVPHVNKQGEYRGAKSIKVVPSPAEVARIATFYAADFERFGYVPDQKAPLAEAPVLSEAMLQERDAALKAMNDPFVKLRRKVRKALSRT